jgi:hypothetical protein
MSYSTVSGGSHIYFIEIILIYPYLYCNRLQLLNFQKGEEPRCYILLAGKEVVIQKLKQISAELLVRAEQDKFQSAVLSKPWCLLS